MDVVIMGGIVVIAVILALLFVGWVPISRSKNQLERYVLDALTKESLTAIEIGQKIRLQYRKHCDSVELSLLLGALERQKKITSFFIGDHGRIRVYKIEST